MDLSSIYVANGTGIFILLILLYASRDKTRRNNLEDKLHSFMVIGVMVACFMEAFSYTVDGKTFPGARFLNYVANTYLYSVNLLLPFCVLTYVDLGLYGDVKRIWQNYKPQIFIGAFMFLINIVNFFVPISYYITPENVYERRLLSYFYYVVILYYCITGLFVATRYEKENGARAFFNFRMFLLPVLLGAGLQFLFYGLSLAWLAAAVGLVGLFMMQQNEMAYQDSLTDTYNRQYLNHILSAWISRKRKFTGIMLDIDRFKYINDTFGHSEGDNALKTVAALLKQSRLDKEWVFRFAGDEFIILKLTDDPDGLMEYLVELNRQLTDYNREEHRYQLSLSFGMSAFDHGNIDSFMREMDEKMYEMKESHHHRHP